MCFPLSSREPLWILFFQGISIVSGADSFQSMEGVSAIQTR